MQLRLTIQFPGSPAYDRLRSHVRGLLNGWGLYASLQYRLQLTSSWPTQSGSGELGHMAKNNSREGFSILPSNKCTSPACSIRTEKMPLMGILVPILARDNEFCTISLCKSTSGFSHAWQNSRQGHTPSPSTGWTPLEAS